MAETITMPKLGFDMQEGTLVRWVRNEGENINKGDVLAEIETDKATVEVESSASGVVRKLLVDQGTVVPIGAPIAIVGSQEEKIDVPSGKAAAPQKSKPGSAAPVTASQGTTAAPVAVPPSSGPMKASPLARKLAKDQQVDLAHVQGTGPGGRIVRRDIEAAMTMAPSGAVGGSAPGVFPAVMPMAADSDVELTKLRQAIARRMTESKTSVPHFYVTHEYNMDAVMALREQVNELMPENEKLSVNDFLVKAAALALRQYPNLNASFAGDKIVRHGSINIGVAVSIPAGLMTVVCRDTDQKPIRQISAEVKASAARAREGKVRSEDIEGSTFSVSNLGMYDVESFVAIINPPEAAILAIGSARQVPVVEKGEIKAGWRMNATLSVDHRVSDGAEAAKFLQTLAAFLEQPLRLLV